MNNYKGMTGSPESGKVVSADEAFDYALECVKNGTDEEKAEFVEWFYSGNWIEEDE